MPDVIYTGSAQCAEGDGTVIWYGTNGGYRIDEPTIWPLLLLSISNDRKMVASVAIGCCGAPTDEHFLGEIHNFRNGGGIRIAVETSLPTNLRSKPTHFTTKHEVKLRSSPQVADAYDEGKSEFLGRAAFGNVVRTYLSGSSGEIVGSQAVHRKLWLFVRMDAASDSRASHDPYMGVRAGWVLSESLPK